MFKFNLTGVELFVYI